MIQVGPTLKPKLEILGLPEVQYQIIAVCGVCIEIINSFVIKRLWESKA